MKSRIKQNNFLDSKLVSWNNRMYKKHPTPYNGIAGYIERSRVNTILQFAKIKSTDSVLEVGCEGGNLLINVPNANRIVGVDISQIALNDAAKLFESQGRFAEFYQCNALNPLPFRKGEFDVIICSEMLEHVTEPRKALENIYNIATNKTRIVISVPIEYPKVLIKRILSSIRLFKVFFPGIEENQSEWHLHAFSKSTLHKIINTPPKIPYQLIKEKEIWYNHYIALFKRD